MHKPFSAIIITYNEAVNLARCLQSIDFADEIVVVDSGSTDETLTIAKNYGARIIHQSWLGYGPQKRFAVEQATHDWVLCLDADERVTPDLRASIEVVLVAPQVRACHLLRRNRFLGRWLRHGEGYPDYVVRLFHRGYAQWSNASVHEHVETGDALMITLTGELLHESEDGVCEYALKQVRYARLQAEYLRSIGKHSGFLQAIGSPLVRFMRFYVIRLGFLDGLAGFAHISLGCLASFLKHLELVRLPDNMDKT